MLVDSLTINSPFEVTYFREEAETVVPDQPVNQVRELQPWLRRLRERIEESIGRPVELILFGSYARGEADADSDVDVLAIIPQLDKCTLDTLLEAAWEVSFESGKIFSVIPVAADELSALTESPFLQNVQREGIRL